VIITAVILEGRSRAQVARDYNVSQAWVSRLVARYHGTGKPIGGPSRPYGPRKTRNPNPNKGSGLADVSQHHIGGGDRI
jgi:transposase